MALIDQCPSAAELDRLLCGTLLHADTERLRRHLERCPRCAAIAGRRPADLPTSQSIAPTDAATLAPPAPPEVGATAVLDPPRASGELGWLTHYRVVKQLGQGGMGLVFHAEDTMLARPVALKIMLPNLATATNRDRFLREARAAAALTHDHVVTIYQVGEANGTPFLAMQLLQGESLDDYLKRGKTLSIGQVCRVGREAALGLAAAHAKGLVHRDIKPANLWLEAPKGRVKILDFGLARVSGDVHLTGSGMVLGTPAYMPPEQARGQALDGRCDLWSLGVVLYRLCAGVLPFGGGDMIAMLTSIAIDEPTPLRELAPDVPPDLAELIHLLLMKDPEGRPKTAREVAERLYRIERYAAKSTKARAGADTPSEAAVEGWTGAAPARPRGKRWGWTLGLAAAVGGACAAALGGAYLYWNHGKTSDANATAATQTTPEPAPPVVVPTPPAESRRGKPPSTTPAIQNLVSRKTESGAASAPLVLEFVNNGQTLAIVDRESVWLRNMATGGYRTVQHIGSAMRSAYQGAVAHAALTADGRTLALIVHGEDGSGRIVLWDVTTGRERGRLPTQVRFDAVAFRSDGHLLATGNATTIYFWDLNQSLANSRAGSLTEAKVTDLAFSPTESNLAIGKGNGQVKVWDLFRNKERWHAAFQAGPSIQGLTYSPDGRWLAATTLDNRFFRVWNSVTGELQANAAGMCKQVGFSPDGRLMAIGSVGLNGGDHRRLDVYDVEAKKFVARSSPPAAHLDFIAAIAFAPDGRTVVTGSSDKTLKFWDVPILPH